MARSADRATFACKSLKNTRVSTALRIDLRTRLPILGVVTRAATDVSPRVAVDGYRASLEQLMAGLERWAPHMGPSAIARQLTRWLEEST